jgi:acid phosphatase (class A)
MGKLSGRISNRTRSAVFVLGLGAAVVSGWPANAQQVPAAAPASEGQPKPAAITGFLPRDKLIDSQALLPPPPAPGSAAQTADDEARKAALPLRESARWKLATRDADYKSPHAVDAFACAIGVTISPEATPHLYILLRRSLIDAGVATFKAKNAYNRTRPFVAAHDDTICSPEEAAFLSKNGSYPSGHSAYGWAWALILTEMIPDKADAIMQRGYQFGQSRVQCGVHWQSDVSAGRVVGAAVVAQLHANPDFITEFRAAQHEVESVRTIDKPGPDCTLEKQAAE